MKSFMLLLFSLFFLSATYAGKIVVEGNSRSYAGKTLAIRTYADYITKSETVLTRSTVDSTGHFRFAFNSKKAVYSFINLGVYRGYIVLKPGKTYKINLPRFKPMNREQQLNPFFRREPLYLKIRNADSSDVNVRIHEFDYVFDGFIGNVTMRKFKRKSLQDVDSTIQAMHRQFDAAPGSYFDLHTYYRFAYLKNITFNRNPETSLKRDFAERPVAFRHPVYNEVFSDVVADYMKNLITAGELDIPYSNYFTVKGLMHHVHGNPLFKQDSLRELFILHALYEGYHEDFFHYKSVRYVTDSLSRNSPRNYIAETAERIRKEVMHLRKGYPAPEFSLPDQDSIIADLQYFRGKFILLHFFSSESYTAIKEMPLLKKLYEKFQRELAIVTISTDKNFSRVLRLAEKHEYNWTFVHYQPSSDILEDYEVLSYPAYHLLSPDGEILMSPAPKPEKLENQLAKMIVKHRRNKLREQHQKDGEENTHSPY